MASKIINRYLDREGLLEEETPDIVRTNYISNLEKQNQSLKEEFSMIKESNLELSLEMEKLKKQLNELFEGKNFMKLLMALAENQGKMSKAIEQMTGKKFDVVLASLNSPE
ncbi:MAG: hypothetical protein IIA61_02460 [Candidatus Marinimicrobia bacterium]|nr:hypothetical protein [Candidatus Neomarinimicrobiota bacterium]